MHYIGVGTFILIFVFFIAALISLFRRKGKKALLFFGLSITSFSAMYLTLVIDTTYINPSPTYGTVNGEVFSTPPTIDTDEFIFEIETSTYNSEEDSIDITIETNLPDDTEVSIMFNKMRNFDDNLPETNLVARKLKADDRISIVNEGKVNLRYERAEFEMPILNGQYGMIASIDIGITDNYKLYEALGNPEEVERNFPNNDFSSSPSVNKYSLHFYQQYLEITNTDNIEDLIATADTINYAELEKNPYKFNDVFVTYTGEVIQIIEYEKNTTIRLAITQTASGYSSNDILYLTYHGETPFLKNDIITIYGFIRGSHVYESQAGYNISLPHLDVVVIE